MQRESSPDQQRSKELLRGQPRPERPLHFYEQVDLNRPMTTQEAASELAMFHKTSEKHVLNAFFNLREQYESDDFVRFRETVNNGHPCIIMEGLDGQGRKKWDDLIDRWTGQPQQHVA